MIDVTCVDATEGLYAVFMDEEGISELVNELVDADSAGVFADGYDGRKPSLVWLCMEMEDAQEWREARVETLALEA
jgi:nitrogen regulatory protein PII-like uncharacterized protein